MYILCIYDMRDVVVHTIYRTRRVAAQHIICARSMTINRKSARAQQQHMHGFARALTHAAKFASSCRARAHTYISSLV